MSKRFFDFFLSQIYVGSLLIKFPCSLCWFLDAYPNLRTNILLVWRRKTRCQILHFLHTTRDNHSAKFSVTLDCSSAVVDNLWHLSLSSLYVRKSNLSDEWMCEKVKEEEEMFHTNVFLVISQGISNSCSPVFSRYMHQEANTLPEGKLPHTTSSFNGGPEEMILLLLTTL